MTTCCKTTGIFLLLGVVVILSFYCMLGHFKFFTYINPFNSDNNPMG